MKSYNKAFKVVLFILLTIAVPYPAFLVGQYAAVSIVEIPQAISEWPVSMVIGFLINLAIVIAIYRYSMTSQRLQAQ